MLWNASAMKGYTIEASDGALGDLNDILFDDANWHARWLVVDTGNWLPGRKVLLPLSALGKPDPERRIFPVALTMQQVKDSPDINTDMPVSRQMETKVYSHYSYDPYWAYGASSLGNDMAMPLVAPLYAFDTDISEPIGDAKVENSVDPHLRSMSAVTGYHIHATDGNIGHVDDFIIDDTKWGIAFIKVDTHNWWPGAEVLITPHLALEINWAERLVYLNIDREKVKNSPPYNPTTTVDGTYAGKLQLYYGMGWIPM